MQKERGDSPALSLLYRTHSILARKALEYSCNLLHICGSKTFVAADGHDMGIDVLCAGISVCEGTGYGLPGRAGNGLYGTVLSGSFLYPGFSGRNETHGAVKEKVFKEGGVVSSLL